MSESKPVKPSLFMACGMAVLGAVLLLSDAQARQASSNTAWVPICNGSSPCTWVEVLAGDAYPDGAVCTSNVQCESTVCSNGRCLRTAGRLCEAAAQCASGRCLLDPSPGYCAAIGAAVCTSDTDCTAGTCDRGYCIAASLPNLAASASPDSVGDLSQTSAHNLPAEPTPNQLGYLSTQDVADELAGSGETFRPVRLIDAAP